MQEFQVISLDRVVESKTNPRRTFRGMEELTESVRAHGVLVPLLVRLVNGDFEIVAGARRYRAAQAAKLPEIPVRVKELGDDEALELQVIENCQREDVHPNCHEAMGARAKGRQGAPNLDGIPLQPADAGREEAAAE